MVAFNKFDNFAEDLAMAQHDLSTDAFTFVLTNTQPVATMDVLACITTIATGTGWSTDVALVIGDAAATGSTYRLTFDDATIEAAGGAIAAFQFVVIYNDTPATPGHNRTDPLLGWYDYGSSVVLASGEKLVIDFKDSDTGVITVV